MNWVYLFATAYIFQFDDLLSVKFVKHKRGSTNIIISVCRTPPHTANGADGRACGIYIDTDLMTRPRFAERVFISSQRSLFPARTAEHDNWYNYILFKSRAQSDYSITRTARWRSMQVYRMRCVCVCVLYTFTRATLARTHAEIIHIMPYVFCVFAYTPRRAH